MEWGLVRSYSDVFAFLDFVAFDDVRAFDGFVLFGAVPDLLEAREIICAAYENGRIPRAPQRTGAPGRRQAETEITLATGCRHQFLFSAARSP